MTERLPVSKEEILSGQLDQRPAKILTLIEARCHYMRVEARRAIQVYFFSDQPDFARRHSPDFLEGFKVHVQTGRPLRLNDLEKHAPQWKVLLPQDPDLLATVIARLAKKYPLQAENSPQLQAALRFADPEVQAAYQRAYGAALDSLLQPPEAAAGRQSAGDPAGVEAQGGEEESVLEEAVDHMEWLDLPDGGVLFKQGDEGDALFILVSGRLRVSVAGEDGAAGRAQIITELGRGEMVGATEVLTGGPRTTTVIATRDSELVKLCQSDLYRLAQQYPQVMLRINRILANRLAAQVSAQIGPLQRVTNTLATFAVAPVTADTPLADFTRQFVRVLAGYGSVLHLTSAQVDSQLGAGLAQTPAGGPENRRLAAWLSQQESEYRYIVYEADSQLSEWSQRCIRQADRVLILAQAGASPRLSKIDSFMARERPTARPELVLLQPGSLRRPAGTRKWLERRKQVQAHYHVRLNEIEDMQRLVRRSIGRALGLVLGGGGARGFAHIGVYDALSEAGFQIDLIGGTSMGAVLGAAYALGMDTPRLLKLVKKMASPLKLFDLTLPVVSFFSSGKITQVLQEIFEDTQIEDLWRPFFCLSSSLTRATSVIHTQGPLWQAVRASSAIPGVFSPLLYEDELLVDGAVLNNLPVDVMQDFSQGGPIVAVNVFPEVDLVKEYQFGPSVSGWQALFGKLNPLSGDIQAPLIFESLLRVIALNDVHQARSKRELADLYIRPPVERFNILGFQAYAEIIQIGYQAANQEIAAWKKAPGASRLKESLPVRPTDHLRRTLDDLEYTLATLT